MALNYKELGFLCGIEIHQQIEGKKLFCECPTTNSRKGEDIRVSRKLRAVIGETGEVDKAAAFEMAKGKEIVYVGNCRESCLVELDEEPPHEINSEALGTALAVAGLLNARVVDEIQVMRKTVVDGSNTTGFQRTALVAQNGYVETSKGKVRIPSVCLEEEACQKIKEDNDSITYRLDRLGIPLIEIATEPDIADNEHAKETAEKLGMILRSTGKVKRGIGTIRQDINVNIKGYPRVEIKGFQDLRLIPKIIEYEISRQVKEIKTKKKAEAHVRKAEQDGTTSFLRPMPGAARMYPETDVAPIAPEATGIDVELIEDRIKKVEKLGIGRDLAGLVVKQHKDSFVIKSAEKYSSIKPTFIAETVCTSPKQVKKQFNVEISPTEEDFTAIFEEIEKGRIAKESVLDILKENRPVKEIIKNYELMSDTELEKELKKIVSENKGMPFNALIGKAMEKLRGKAPGKRIAEILKRLAE